MWPVRRIFRLFWWILCCLTLMALPLVIWDFYRKGYNIKYQAWFIGGIFVILSFPISIYEVAMHTEYYTRPNLQRHVIRILWMVPIYGVDAWFALRFRDAREYLDPVRECYEAYVIWNFFAYLMAYLEEELGDTETYLETRKPPMRHVPPFRWFLKPWPMGSQFLLQCKKGVMNYVILRPVCTAIGLITDIFGRYGKGQLDPHKSYVYLISVTNFSQAWALYCLAQFYWATHKELSPIRPLSKFLCIKAVVFLTFWQGVVIAILVSSGIISDESWTTYDQMGVAAGIQDFLVCIEMFVAALAHAYAFPPKDYMDPSNPTKGFLHNVKHMFDLRDVVSNMGEVVESHVDTATEVVTSTLVTVPKKAVKGAAKGIKAALFTSGDSSKRSKKSRRKRHKGREHHASFLSGGSDEEQGRGGYEVGDSSSEDEGDYAPEGSSEAGTELLGQQGEAGEEGRKAGGRSQRQGLLDEHRQQLGRAGSEQEMTSALSGGSRNSSRGATGMRSQSLPVDVEAAAEQWALPRLPAVHSRDGSDSEEDEGRQGKLKEELRTLLGPRS